MEEFKESVKEAIKKRVESPLFGYIFLSMLLANWDALLILAFSEEPIEARISTIVTKDWYFYLIRCALPILSGVALAFLYPYAHMFMERFHGKANTEKKSNLSKAIEDEHEAKLREIQRNVKASYAEQRYIQAEKDDAELETQTKAASIAAEKEKQTKAAMGIANAKDELEKLIAEKNSVENHISSLKDESNAQTTIMLSLMNKIRRVISDIGDYSENKISADKLKEKLERFLTADEALYFNSQRSKVRRNDIERKLPLSFSEIREAEILLEKSVERLNAAGGNIKEQNVWDVLNGKIKLSEFQLISSKELPEHLNEQLEALVSSIIKLKIKYASANSIRGHSSPTPP